MQGSRGHTGAVRNVLEEFALFVVFAQCGENPILKHGLRSSAPTGPS
jgi:hypothetical protein